MNISQKSFRFKTLDGSGDYGKILHINMDQVAILLPLPFYLQATNEKNTNFEKKNVKGLLQSGDDLTKINAICGQACLQESITFGMICQSKK